MNYISMIITHHDVTSNFNCKYSYWCILLLNVRLEQRPGVLLQLSHQPKNAPIILVQLPGLNSSRLRCIWLPVSQVEFYTLPFSSSQRLQVDNLFLHSFSIYIWNPHHPLELLFQAVWREKTRTINVCQENIIKMEVSWHTASLRPINLSLCIIKWKLIYPSIWLWLHMKSSAHWAMEHNP